MDYEIPDATFLAKQEKPIHSKCLAIFITLMIFYFGAVFFAFSDKNAVTNEIRNKTSEIEDKNSSVYINITAFDDSYVTVMYQFVRTDNLNFFNVLFNYFHRLRWSIIFFVIASFLTSLLCIPIVGGIPKFLIAFMLFIECVLYASAINKIITVFSGNELNGATIACFSILKLFFFWESYAKLYVIYHLKIRIISEVIKESCRAITSSPYLILLTFINSILIFLVTILTYYTFVTIKITNLADPFQFQLAIFKYTSLVTGFWLTAFIMSISQIICARTFIIWFYSTRESPFLNNTPSESIFITFRYHLGAACHAASPWAYLIFMIIMLKNLLNKARETRYNIFVLIPCYWSTFLTLFDGSCTMIAMQGTGFKKSADSACQIYLKHPLHLYGIYKGFVWCVECLLALFIIICGLIFAGVIRYNIFQNMSNFINFSICILFCMLPAIMLIESAVSTITLCIFKELEYEKQSPTRPSFINAKLRSLFLTEKL